MSLADLLPVRISRLDRPARKHRAPDEIDRQKMLRAGADLLIKGLRLQLEEQEKRHEEQEKRHEEVIARIDARHAEIVEGLERQVADLKRRVDIGVKAEHVIAKTQELSVEEIRRHCVMPLHKSPLANPAHVPAWACKDDDTQPIPAA